MTFKNSGIVNLTAFKMSPHVGTHADAPVHIQGDLETDSGKASDLGLEAFLGPVRVVDIAPHTKAIELSELEEKLDGQFPERILFKTRHRIRYDKFEDDYSYVSEELAQALSDSSVKLIGLDTPSVDHVDSKDLKSHHILHEGGLVWLENLDLTAVDEGDYTLVALPLKLEELEASPVRAILIS